MKLGVITVLYHEFSLEEALDRVAALGLAAVELGTGNYPGNAHCDPDELLSDPGAVARLRRAVSERGLIISALRQHGNPLHPNEDVARESHEVWRKTLRVAELLEVPVINAFPGCPGDHEGARWPNWVTCAWPPDFLQILDWQWNEKVIPYWSEEVEHARRHGVRIGFEPHPGTVVYNPRTLLRLREACGEVVGANVDPSHLFWQGIDPIEAIRVLGEAGAIFHVHAKDLALESANMRRNGVLETLPYERVRDRSWNFRTCGYGHGEHLWRQIVSELRKHGYDYVLSIEHEDPLMSPEEGLAKAVEVLSKVLIREPAGEMYWA
jgi:sugar phosphate isomerase/epimerase